MTPATEDFLARVEGRRRDAGRLAEACEAFFRNVGRDQGHQ
jgi:hypothetical protein